MRAWLQPLLAALDRGEAAILVHVADLAGSGPREVGAQMLVMERNLVGTIGGGELEHTATLKARELLQGGGAALVRLALGPELNQCCGGAVTLAFEPFAPADLAWVRKLAAAAAGPEPVIRTVWLDDSGSVRRDWEQGGEGLDYSVSVQPSPLAGEGGLRRQPKVGRGDHWKRPSVPPLQPLAQTRGVPSPARGDGWRTLIVRERMNPPSQSVWLFGAGHVGRAVAKALHPLGFALTWIDGRAGQFPEPSLDGVRQLALAMPELLVDEAPAGTSFLVMTHSHALDEAICEAVLRRGDFSYLGLIGSKTKRAQFRRRLAEAGIPPGDLDRMTCPVGLREIRSKEPALIAASVAADLLIRRERLAARVGGRVGHG